MHTTDLTERMATISVAARSGTYIARAAGWGVTASCTVSPLWAARAVALKLKYGRQLDKTLRCALWQSHGITIEEVPGSAGALWHATWHDPYAPQPTPPKP